MDFPKLFTPNEPAHGSNTASSPFQSALRKPLPTKTGGSELPYTRPAETPNKASRARATSRLSRLMDSKTATFNKPPNCRRNFCACDRAREGKANAAAGTFIIPCPLAIAAPANRPHSTRARVRANHYTRRSGRPSRRAYRSGPPAPHGLYDSPSESSRR